MMRAAALIAIAAALTFSGLCVWLLYVEIF